MEGVVKMTTPSQYKHFSHYFRLSPYFQALNILSPMFCDTYCMGSFA